VRKPYIAGNWKMNLDRRGALALVAAIRDHSQGADSFEVAVAPPSVYLEEVARAASGSAVKVGAQNMCDEVSGAFTGELSAEMLEDVGATFVILGHSERRHIYGESDGLVNAKVLRALTTSLDVILCVGETIEEREAKDTETVVRRQLTEGLAGVTAGQIGRVTIAYEPVWAIGTGLTASPAQAGEVHEYLRGLISGLYDQGVANSIRIQYGGSVKPGNAAELLSVPDIDGALVGGAALKAETFLPILDATRG
jgi:triosephosphate isomerase